MSKRKIKQKSNKISHYLITIHLYDGSVFKTNTSAPDEDTALDVALSRLHFQTGGLYDKTHAEIELEVFR